MRLTANLNSTATAALAGAPKLRIRATDGALQIKPTDRVAGNLPKGEKIVTVSKRSPNTAKFSLRGDLGGSAAALLGGAAELVPGKYGWFTLQAADSPIPGAATVKVVAS